jgi:signal transduction histidine kinase
MLIIGDVILAMYAHGGTHPRSRPWNTIGVVRDEIAQRWRSVIAWLRHTTPPPPRLTPWGWAADGILAVLLAIGAVNGALRVQDDAYRVIEPMIRGPQYPPIRPLPPLPPNLIDGVHLHWWEFLLAALTALPLLTRRRFPLLSFWIIALATARTIEINGATHMWTVVAVLIAAYSAPAYSRYRNLALISVAVGATLIISGSGGNLPNLGSWSLVLLLGTLIGLGANAMHTWRQRAAAQQREREAATRLALEQERARLARELHDVVGHNVSVMIIQAGAARKMLDLDPDQAREALLAVEAGGRAAMTELRQVIGVLTVDADGADLAPQPGLQQLSDLAARVRDTGVPVTLTLDGTFAELPAGIELAAYRVVQEALTNAVKHAAGAAVDIKISGTPEELRVEVTDTGGSSASVTPGSGRGLAGLRDRVAAHGGTLTADRRPTGGFRVVAVTPLQASQ